MSNTVLAIVGLPGSGKSEVTKVCLDSGLFPGHIHFGQITFDEVKRRGLESNESNERIVREVLREEHGMGAYAKLSMPRIEELYSQGNVILESFYSTEEYELLKKVYGNKFKVLAAYAPQQVRMKRLEVRPVRPLTPNETISRDISQIKNTHQAGPIALADHTIINVGTTKDLKKNVLTALEQLGITGP